ncbi:unnamed protein product, partial [Ectocarpus sp. 12 AP-2014]
MDVQQSQVLGIGFHPVLPPPVETCRSSKRLRQLSLRGVSCIGCIQRRVKRMRDPAVTFRSLKHFPHLHQPKACVGAKRTDARDVRSPSPQSPLPRVLVCRKAPFNEVRVVVMYPVHAASLEREDRPSLESCRNSTGRLEVLFGESITVQQHRHYVQVKREPL